MCVCVCVCVCVHGRANTSSAPPLSPLLSEANHSYPSARGEPQAGCKRDIASEQLMRVSQLPTLAFVHHPRKILFQVHSNSMFASCFFLLRLVLVAGSVYLCASVKKERDRSFVCLLFDVCDSDLFPRAN